MAANEVIEILDSGSSDDSDEFHGPPRKPIGWNYQGTASKMIKDESPVKVNGTVHKPPVSAEEESDIEIVEVSSVNTKPREHKPIESYSHRPIAPSHRPIAPSSHRPIAPSNKPITPSHRPIAPSTLKPIVSSSNKPIMPSSHKSIASSSLKPAVSSSQKPVVTSSPRSIMPSSSRSEIRKIIRNTSQSNIGKFFPKKGTSEADFPKEVKLEPNISKKVKSESEDVKGTAENVKSHPTDNKTVLEKKRANLEKRKTDLEKRKADLERKRMPLKPVDGSEKNLAKSSDVVNRDTESEKVDKKSTGGEKVDKTNTEGEKADKKDTKRENANKKDSEIEIVDRKETEIEIVDKNDAEIEIVNKKATEKEMVDKDTKREMVDKNTEKEKVDKDDEKEKVDKNDAEKEKVDNDVVMEEVDEKDTEKEKVDKSISVKENVDEEEKYTEQEKKPLEVQRTSSTGSDENSETSVATMESFMNRWSEIKSTSDDVKIRDRLWKYYYLSDSSYTHSRKFISLVDGSARKLSLDNIYVVVKNLLDSLKYYKDRPYKEKNNGEAQMGSATASPLPEETEEDVKRNKKLRKVEKKMAEISKRIKRLEEQEIDLSDEDNSSYLMEDRLKRQFSKLHDYYCKIAECSPATGRPIERKFRFTGSRYEEVNKRITAWVNKTKEFPDYVDILNLLKKVTKDSLLPLRPETVRVQAQEIFREVGRMLKDRRESDDLYNLYSYVDDVEKDPATEDEELAKKLTKNGNIAKEKLDQIFQEYVDKEAEARENADKQADRQARGKAAAKAAAIKESKAKSTNPEQTVKTEVPSEEEEEEDDDEESEEEEDVEDPDDAEMDPEVYEDAEGDPEAFEDAEGDPKDFENAEVYTDIDEDEEEEDEEEVIDDRQVREDPNCKDDDELEDTDDELRDVIASASVEEELSEEDVPVIDSEEVKYVEEQDGASSSSIVCLDDTSNDSTDRQLKDPVKTVKSIAKEEYFEVDILQSSPNKRKFDEDFSPQKRPCTEVLNP